MDAPREIWKEYTVYFLEEYLMLDKHRQVYMQESAICSLFA